MKAITITLLALALAAPAAAQIPAGVYSNSTSELDLMFRSGRTIEGKVTKLEGNRVQLDVDQGIATQNQWHKLGEFTDYSAFRIKSAVTPETPEGELALARFANDHNLTMIARRCVAHARKLSKNPKLGADLIPAIEHREAKKLEKRFDRELARGDVAEARDTLRLLFHSHGKLYDNAKRTALSEKLAKRVHALHVAAAEARTKRRRTAQDEAFASEVRPLQRDLERARFDVSQAMNGNRRFSFSRSITELGFAIRHYDHVHRRAALLVKRYGDRPDLMQTVNAIQLESSRGWKDSLLDQASYYFTRTSYSEAFNDCNRILARYPNDKEALEMRSQIAVAAMGGGWGWGYGQPYTILPPLGMSRGRFHRGIR